MPGKYPLMILPWIPYFFLMYSFRRRLLGELRRINRRLIQLEGRFRRENR